MSFTLSLDGVLAFQEEEGEEPTEETTGTEAEETKDPPNPVLPVGKELLWAAVFFFLLWTLMKFVLLPPIQRMRGEREAKIRGDRDAVEKSRDALAASRSDYQASLTGARAEANRLIDEARAAADERKDELQAVADREITELRRAAQAEIVQARLNAMDALRGDVGDLAVQAASIVIQRDLDRVAQQGTIDTALSGS